MPRTTHTPDGRELVHHSRCGDWSEEVRPDLVGVHPLQVHTDGSRCPCPPSWPRLKEDSLIAHRWNGNCLRGEIAQPLAGPFAANRTTLCVLHGEPRGSCTHCQQCGGCEAGRRAQEAMTAPAPVPFVLFVEADSPRTTYWVYAVGLDGRCLADPWSVDWLTVAAHAYPFRGWLDAVRERLSREIHARPLKR